MVDADKVDGAHPFKGYNEVLDFYANWLLDMRDKEKWEVLDVHGPIPNGPLYRTRYHLDGDACLTRRLEPQGSVLEADRDTISHDRAGAGDVHRLGQRFRHPLDGTLRSDHLDCRRLH